MFFVFPSVDINEKVLVLFRFLSILQGKSRGNVLFVDQVYESEE